MGDQVSLVEAAEQLTRAGAGAEAAEAWQAVVEVNPVNGIFWARLAAARFETGDFTAAVDAYRKAAELGVWPIGYYPPFPPIFPGELAYQIARCQAALGEREAAIQSLAEAVGQGLRDLGKIRGDVPELADHPKFDEIVGPAGPAEGASRDERWRADLRFLRSELARRVPGPHVLDLAFDEAADALVRAVPDLDDGRIVVGIWGLLRRLGDGHAFVSVEDAWPEWTRALPVWFFLFDASGASGPRERSERIDTCLLITETAAGHGHLAGAEVLAVDGHPAAEVLAALDPLLTRDNEYTPLSRGPMWMRIPAYLHAVGVAARPDAVTLTVRLLSGEVTDEVVEADPPLPEPRTWMNARPRSWPTKTPADSVRPTVETPAYLRDVDNPFWFEYQAAGNLVYFQFNSVRDTDDETLAAFYPRLFAAIGEHDAGALVIDIRWNGGGNTFLAQPLIHHVLARPDLPVFVIIGRGTYSAAQNTATLLDRHTQALFVGEPTGSAPNFVGEAIPFRLPASGILVNISDLYWQTSWPFDHRVAIAPRVYAPPTAAAYLAGRDPAMDAVREHLGSRAG